MNVEGALGIWYINNTSLVQSNNQEQDYDLVVNIVQEYRQPILIIQNKYYDLDYKQCAVIKQKVLVDVSGRQLSGNLTKLVFVDYDYSKKMIDSSLNIYVDSQNDYFISFADEQKKGKIFPLIKSNAVNNAIPLIVGDWIIGSDYAVPNYGYSSAYKSSEDMVNENVSIYKDGDSLLLKCDKDIFKLETKKCKIINNLDFVYNRGFDRSKELPSGNHIINLVFLQYYPNNTYSASVYIDDQQKIYIGFGEYQGDCGVFPLIRK